MTAEKMCRCVVHWY